MGWLILGVVPCGPHYREFPGDAAAVQDADPPLGSDPPTLDETRRAVNQLKNWESWSVRHLRRDAHCGGAAVILWLHTLLCSMAHGDHPDRLETGRCSNLEGKG